MPTTAASRPQELLSACFCGLEEEGWAQCMTLLGEDFNAPFRRSFWFLVFVGVGSTILKE